VAIQRLRFEVDASPAYEFVLSLAAATAGSLPWSAPRAIVAEVSAFSGGCDMVWAHLLTVAYDSPPPRTVDSFLEAVQATHPRELRLRLAGYYVRYFRRATSPDVIAAAMDGDRQAIRGFLATSYPEDAAWQAALRELLALTAWETRRRLVRVLRQWHAVFEGFYQPDLLTKEVAARRAESRRLRPEQVVAKAVDGWEYVPEPGINALLLVPSEVVWPAVHVFDHRSTKLICYPVRRSSAPDPVAPPRELLAIGQAVADERRLRILRVLASGELPAQELSVRLAIGLTTLLHHLAVLRGAGLVGVRGTHRKLYSMRRERVAALGVGLERFLRA
jgi:DNA-binding transcriptional ArsR family regulator